MNDFKTHFLRTFRNEPEQIFSLQTVKWFQVFQPNSNNSIYI